MAKYSVVGRYMEGTIVTGYHIVGDDGFQKRVSKKQLIDYIKKEEISNCRIQTYKGKILIRGKGININELPVQTASGEVKQGKEQVQKSLGQLEITGRIMDKNNCVGYLVMDTSGVERKISRDKVIELASNKLIANATTQKYKGDMLLRGNGVELNSLPSIQMKREVAPLESEQKPKVDIIRANKAKQKGALKNMKTKEAVEVNQGDYIVCNKEGLLEVVDKDSFTTYVKTRSKGPASGDSLIGDTVKNYRIITKGEKGKVSLTISKEAVLKWQKYIQQ